MPDVTTIKNSFLGGMRSKEFTVFGAGESAELINLYPGMGTLQLAGGSRALAPTPFYTDGGEVSDIVEYSANGLDWLIARVQRSNATEGPGFWWIRPNAKITVSGNHAIGVDSIKISGIEYLPSYSYKVMIDGVYYTYSKDASDRTKIFLTAPTTVPIASGAEVVVDNWMPLTCNALTAAGTAYLTAGTGRQMVQVGKYCYFNAGYNGANAAFGFTSSPNPNTLFRWDGFLVYKHRVICASNTTVTLEINTVNDDWTVDPDANGMGPVLPGDIITFVTYEGFTSRVIKAVTATQLTLSYAGPDAQFGADCFITRIHRAGVPAGTTAVAAQANNAASCETGNWQFMWRYKNSHTGRTGNLSTASDLVFTDGSAPTNNALTVSGWLTNPPDLDIDQVEIFYRYQAAAAEYPTGAAPTGQYYLLRTLSRTETGYTFADNALKNSVGLPMATLLTEAQLYHDRPGQVDKIAFFNDRLYVSGYGDAAHWLYFSSTGEHEYFPTLQFGSTLPEGGDFFGGAIPLGATKNERIMGMLPEGGMFTAVGVAGDGLLIFLRNRATRLYGDRWSNFTLMQGIAEPCVSSASITRIPGGCAWLSDRGPVMLSFGSSSSQMFGEPMYPRGLSDKIPTVGTLKWSSCFWNGHIVYSCIYQNVNAITDSSPNNMLLFYNLSAGTWRAVDLAAVGLLTDAQGRLLVGRVGTPAVDVMTTEYTTRPNYATTPVSYVGLPIKYLSDPIYMTGDAGKLANQKHVARLALAFKNDSATPQSVVVKLYLNGDLTTPIYTSDAQAIAANAITIVKVSPEKNGIYFQVEVSGTITTKIRLMWYLLFGSIHAY